MLTLSEWRFLNKSEHTYSFGTYTMPSIGTWGMLYKEAGYGLHLRSVSSLVGEDQIDETIDQLINKIIPLSNNVII